MMQDVYKEPYRIHFTFEQVPGADGYQYYTVSKGAQSMPKILNQPSDPNARLSFDTDYEFNCGPTYVYVSPFVFDVDGTTRLYGAPRSVIFNMTHANWGGAGRLNFWETTETIKKDTLEYNVK